MATPLGVSPLTLNFTEILSARKEGIPVTVTLNTVDASKKYPALAHKAEILK